MAQENTDETKTIECLPIGNLLRIALERLESVESEYIHDTGGICPCSICAVVIAWKLLSKKLRIVTPEQYVEGYIQAGPNGMSATKHKYKRLRINDDGNYIVEEPIREVTCQCGGRGLCGVCDPMKGLQ